MHIKCNESQQNGIKNQCDEWVEILKFYLESSTAKSWSNILNIQKMAGKLDALLLFKGIIKTLSWELRMG